jgi:hypothetical protein
MSFARLECRFYRNIALTTTFIVQYTARTTETQGNGRAESTVGDAETSSRVEGCFKMFPRIQLIISGLFYQKRNLIVVETEGVGPHQPTFDLVNDPSGSTMIFPVFFLYPQHATSDTISDFAENTRFYDHLTAMFPPKGEVPSWDEKGDYRTDNLVIHAMTRSKRLLKVGKKTTLMDVFNASAGKDGASDGLELKQGYLSFVVLPKGEQESRWVNEYKSIR